MEDLIGKKFGKITVLSYLGLFSTKHCARYMCQCECGDTFPMNYETFIGGDSLGCASCRSKTLNPFKNYTYRKTERRGSGKTMSTV